MPNPTTFSLAIYRFAYPCVPSSEGDCRWSEITHYGLDTGILRCLTHGGYGTVDRLRGDDGD